MPTQTTKKAYIFFPDGGKVSVKEDGAVSYTDIGAINSAIQLVLNYDENEVNTANAGKLAKQIRNMSIAGSLDLINLEPDIIEKLGGGMFENVVTAGSPVATVPDQTIAAGWDDDIVYPLVLETSSSDDTELQASAKPTLTSVTLDPSGTPEALVEGTEYVLVEDSNAFSGWGIVFISANMSTGSPKTFDIEIDYASVTPVAGTTTHLGNSTETLAGYAIKVEHYNDSGAIDRSFEVYLADTASGGFSFNFKGANEDGVDTTSLSFNGRVDTDRTPGRQLANLYTKAAA